MLKFSISGGAGSGMGTRLLEKMQEDWPADLYSSFVLVPEDKTSAHILSPYNAVLAFHKLVEYTQICAMFDNTALTRFCSSHFQIATPSLADMNTIFRDFMLTLTSALRMRCEPT